MKISIKRIYDPPSADDGKRILVDRLWPRGLSKQKAKVDEWLKDVAPTAELRKWYGHDSSKWKEFKKRYKKELSEKDKIIESLIHDALAGKITLLYAARDRMHNNAVVLKEFLLEAAKRDEN
jgi:uncharacterized protein YeaO (DUF488 family)